MPVISTRRARQNPTPAPKRLRQQVLQPAGDVGALVELHRVAVLRARHAERDLAEVCRELRELKCPLHDVVVWLSDVPPCRESASVELDGQPLLCGRLVLPLVLLKADSSQLPPEVVHLVRVFDCTDLPKQMLNVGQDAFGLLIAELPANWAAIRRRVLARDRGRCAIPGCTTPATDVDHRVDRHSHHPDDLQSLCADHHRAKTLQEAQAARAAILAKAKHPREQHPGLRRR